MVELKEEDMREKFSKLNLKKSSLEQVLKNKKIRIKLWDTMLECESLKLVEFSKETGLLIFQLASLFPVAVVNLRKNIIPYIINGKINIKAQLEEGCKYFKKKSEWNKDAFEKAAGIGLDTSDKAMYKLIDEYFKTNESLIKKKGWAVENRVCGNARKTNLKFWSKRGELFKILQNKFSEIAGPKPSKGAQKKLKKKVNKEEDSNQGFKEVSGRDLKWARNTAKQEKEHLKATKGVIMRRFPPEPNGYLHIGHAKSICFNFKDIPEQKWETLLRYDDTNPTAESKEYIDAIEEYVRWLGKKPSKITYSSTYFPQLYQFAVQLIKQGNAYICNLTREEAQVHRDMGKPSPGRKRSVEENLRIFENMKKGKYEQGEYVLRMMGDPTSSNFNMKADFIFYRIMYAPHPHVGSEWCIYPTYDFTHCIIDSLEHIDYSCCTKEFEERRETYYWLLDVLGLYKPKVWEFARLNITNNVMSKRIIKALVESGVVGGWDDPRLLTLAGLRNRGIPPQAIVDFCNAVGVSRKDTIIKGEILNQYVRATLNPIAKRSMACVYPIKVVLENFEKEEEFDARDTIDTTHKIKLTKEVYIDSADFRENAGENYFRLTPGKIVMLKYAACIKCTGFEKQNGKITLIKAQLVPQPEEEPKGKIHWVPSDNTVVQINLYNPLFTVKEVPSKSFRDYVNPNSEVIVTNAVADNSVKNTKVGEVIQFERNGYFKLHEVKNGKMVFWSTTMMKQSNTKGK